MQGSRTEPRNTEAKGNAFPTGHLTSQSNALDVSWYTHFLPDTWQNNPMHWTCLGTHVSYRTPDKPIQSTWRDSVHTFPTGHLKNQSNALDVARFTQRVSHVALYQRALRSNALVSSVSIWPIYSRFCAKLCNTACVWRWELNTQTCLT